MTMGMESLRSMVRALSLFTWAFSSRAQGAESKTKKNKRHRYAYLSFFFVAFAS